MIPDQWYPIFEARKLKRRPVGVERLGERWVLWRDGEGRAVCMVDRCPHRGVALSRGRVREGELECGYHGFRFAASGACTAMPCEGPDARIPQRMCAATRPLREEHGLLWLCHGDPARAPASLPWFEEIDPGSAIAARTSFEWPANWVRTIESNFDVHHVPWLHGSISPRSYTRVDPYDVKVEGRRIRTWGRLGRPDGSKGVDFRVELEAPSVSLLDFAGLRFLVADCPIDEERTWRFACYEQDWVRVPGLGRLTSWLVMQADLRITQLREDLPMVATQRPRQPAAGGGGAGDLLVRADAGTAAWLRLRRRLLEEAATRA